MDRLFFIALAVFFCLFGLLTVTNVQIEWSKPLLGFSALVAGVICTVRGFR